MDLISNHTASFGTVKKKKSYDYNVCCSIVNKDVTLVSLMLALVQVSIATLLIQLPSNSMGGKRVENGSSLWAPAPMLETWEKFLAPGFNLPQPWQL